MSVSKDPERGTFYVQCRYRDWTGEPKKKTKRGFKTEEEARKWEYEFLKRMEGAPTMLFSEFYEVYAEDTKMRLRQTTRETKANMIESKILPFLGHKRLNEITALDILNWENELMAMRTSNGLEYSQTYLHSICNQLSAMLNHAVRYYGLESNPMAKVYAELGDQVCELAYIGFDPYLFMLYFELLTLERCDRFPGRAIYECGPRGSKVKALWNEMYHPTQENPYLNNAKSVYSLDVSWAETKLSRETQNGSLVLADIFDIMSELPYATRKRAARVIRSYLVLIADKGRHSTPIPAPDPDGVG